MKTNVKLFPGLALGCCLALCLGNQPIQAGDLTVDNLTVNTSATGVLPTVGTAYVLVEQSPGDTDTGRGTKLQAALTKARAMSPSADKRVVVLVPPGVYQMTSTIQLDTAYMDLVGMVPAQMTTKVIRNETVFPIPQTVALTNPACPVRIWNNDSSAVNLIELSAAHVHIANLIIEKTGNPNSSFHTIPPSWDDVVVEHVKFVGYIASRTSGVGGTYRDCVSGNISFYFQAKGFFEDCVAGNNSFGGQNTSIASGTFIGCSAGTGSFGYQSATGVFKNCVAGDDSFGRSLSASGSFDGCIGGIESFGSGAYSSSASASGAFKNCAAGEWSFGGENCATGIFERCRAGEGSFGKQNNPAKNDYSHDPVPRDFAIKINPQGDLSMGDFTTDNP